MMTITLVVSGSIAFAIASPSTFHFPASTSGGPALLPHWSTPANEVGAPDVPTPGGAAIGEGNFNAISCSSSIHCVAVGGDNQLRGIAATSTNGGSNWNAGSVSSNLPELDAVDCRNATACVAVGQGAVATTIDGGSTWASHTIPATNTTLLGVSCTSATVCVSVGVSSTVAGTYAGHLLLSSDGGITWATPTLPSTVAALGSVDCPTSTFCVAVGEQILVSTDGGASWTQRFVNGGTGALRSVSCASATDCVAIGANLDATSNSSPSAFEVLTTDGGLTWTAAMLPAGSGLSIAIACSSGTSCVVSGSSIGSSVAPIWTSNDGGSTWSNGTAPPGVTAVGALNCASVTTCVFAGLHGQSPVVGVSSGGSSWATSSISSVAASQSDSTPS
jgi:photosystem II stability/assembly factor-like uncharacterized protein